MIWFAVFMLCMATLPAMPFLIPSLYGAIYWRWMQKTPGDTLVMAAVELLDKQPLAWHPAHHGTRMAHPEGFLITRYSLMFNDVEFKISETAKDQLRRAHERRDKWLQEHREAQALGVAA